jgi:hypothetical protein
MRESEPGTARQEAERLVFTVVAAARRAAGGAGHRDAGPPCCACPVCRALAALREPDPRVVEHLAARAGDLAAGVAGLLRSASARPHGPSGAGPSGAGPSGGDSASARPHPAGPTGGDDEAWREATRGGQTGAPRRPDDAWGAATRTEGDPAGPPQRP